MEQLCKLFKKDLTIFNKIAIQARAEMAADKYVVGYRDSKCTNLSVYCPYQEIVCFVLKHINTARMPTISRQFIPLIYGNLGKKNTF